MKDMTVGELKSFIESEQISDDFVVDIMGEHSGSFGSVLRASKRIVPFPDGDYKEFQLFIGA